MAIVVSKAVWSCSNAKGNARLVLLALADHVYEETLDDNEGAAYAWPSQSRLARYCKCSRSTVEEALKSLAEDGEIEDTEERKWGQYRGTVIWEVLPGVDFDDLPDMTEIRSPDRKPVMTDSRRDLTDLPADLTDSRRDLTDGPVTNQKEASNQPEDQSGFRSSSTSRNRGDALQEEQVGQQGRDVVKGTKGSLGAREAGAPPWRSAAQGGSAP